ncbi:MAG: hypothetical protein IK026_01545 [Eubacteriaceae bacterium]|nr:hypothetical protein [Eubacteriaceae bacterium]MBR5995255.1 hypothetical protein [Eubacteriaceae bacterium]
MGKEKFSEDELVHQNERETPYGTFYDFSTPISYRDNTLLLYQGKTPLWTPFSSDFNRIMCDCDPENQARSNPPGGKGEDGWGVTWEFVDSAHGAIVRPGNPMVTDINKWEEQVAKIPDADTWDWEGTVERQYKNHDPNKATYVAMPGCLFERLIALCDFEDAIVALIDDDQKDAVHRLFRVVTDNLKKYYNNIKKYLNADIANFNDDWGSQQRPFFSNATAKEMLFPYVKELVDHVHSLGMYWDDHCCGHVEDLFDTLFIPTGMDSWGGQELNDKRALKEKYGDRFIFTSGPVGLTPNSTEKEVDEAVEDFFAHEGADNRILCSPPMGAPASLKEKLYIAGRKNYDRLVAEGKAIL